MLCDRFFEFGFIGLWTVPPAKEIEGLGQPLPLWKQQPHQGRGKETSAFEMVLSPRPPEHFGLL